MKILHVSYGDFEGAGGTSIAVNRLHNGLLKAGHSSKILCRVKSLQTNESIRLGRSISEYVLKKIFSPLGLNGLEGTGTFRIDRVPDFKEADILHLHTIHSGYFSYPALPHLTARKPTVWTHHDIWAVTGHCTYSYDCVRWKTGCGKCPYPDHYPAIKRDATAFEWKLKNWVYRRSRFHLVAASRWFFDMLKESMLRRFPIDRIPWGIDTDIYKPLDKEHCRSVLGIPPGKRVLMFGAMNAKLHNKGADLLLKAVEKLPESLKKELVFLTIGHRGDDIFAKIGVPAVHAGYVMNDQFKAIAYSAADLYILPTRAETFSLAAIESMACGTPVVSFDVCSMSELIQTGQTGYLAEAENPDDLAKGMVSILEDEALRASLSQKCRSAVLKEYTLELQTNRYVDLYRKILE